MKHTDKQRTRVVALLRAGLPCLLVAAVVLCLFAADAFALRVSLKRIIFEGRERSQVITIINNTDKEQTYRLGWRNFRMTEDKLLENVEEGEHTAMKVAEPFLRYAPRRVTIPAGQSQQVRIMARLTKDMEDGEYRSHLYIAPEATPPTFTPEELKLAKTKPVVKIEMLTGLSLPVFIRKGDLKASATFSDAKLVNAGDKMKFSVILNREGNRSLYGDFDFVCMSGGSEIVAKQTLGIAVYAEVAKRKLDFEIPFPEGGAAACPQMKVVYLADHADSQYQGGVIAETTVSLQ